MSSSSVSNFASAVGNTFSKLNPFDSGKTKAEKDPMGIKAGEVERIAAETDTLALDGGRRGLVGPEKKRASAGTIVSEASVAPKLEELTNLFATRSAFLRQRRAAPGLRGSTSGASILGNTSGSGNILT